MASVVGTEFWGAKRQRIRFTNQGYRNLRLQYRGKYQCIKDI